jgi:hypothetical protein
MTNRDRDSVAKLLLLEADRLAEAPNITLENATRNHPESPCPYQVGALEERCRQTAHAIRALVSEYLTQRVGAASVRGRK